MERFFGLSKKEKALWLIAALAVTGAIVHGFDRLFLKGVFSWHIAAPEFRAMMLELAVLFAAFTLLGRYTGGRVRLVAMTAVYAAALWIHVILIPVLVSGAYLLYLCLTGKWIRRVLSLGRGFGRSGAVRIEAGRDFLVGSMAVICLFCLMSAAHVGTISRMWAAVLISGAVLAAAEIAERVRQDRRKGGTEDRKEDGIEAGIEGGIPEARCLKGESGMSWAGALGAAFVLSAFFLQAARMNISVDYDSLWYGVRAPYILNNGGGIYENLGTVAVVYTYSKGWETLTLPLSVLPSYSFLISFNLWMTAGAVWAAFQTAGYYMGRRRAAFLAVFLSSLPVIMNMGITAKTDSATLFVQLLMIFEIVRFLSGEEESPLSLYYSFGALLLSWTMKPTAMVFSTAVFGMSFLYLLVSGNLSLRTVREETGQAALVCLLAVGTLAGIWRRTWLLTGLPVTSVFSRLLTRIGFRLKYPFGAHPIPNSGSGLDLGQGLTHLLSRLYGMILNPTGEDMSHVILAWGGLTIWLVGCIWICRIFLAGKEQTASERRLDGWLLTVLVPFLAVNLVSLFLLTQVDGNYFMLLYVLLVLWGFRLAERLKEVRMRRCLLALSLPVMAFSLLVTAVSGWSWSLGFTPVNVINRGYYNHEEEWHARLAASGNGTIWEILAQNPRNRLISIGSHPESLMFPCCVQSYTDITGSNGNVVLVKTMDNFVEFLRYAGTDYVYAEAGWIHPDERSWSLTCDLIEYGILTPVCYENGNMLAEVNTEGQRTEDSAARLEEFQARYAAGL